MSLVDFKIDEVFLQSHTMSFKLPANDPKVLNLAEDITLEFENEFYYITELGPVRRGGEAFVEVTAQAEWYRLGERNYPGSFAIQAMTPGRGVFLIRNAIRDVGDFEWNMGLVPTSDDLVSMELSDASYLDLLYQWAKISGCEIKFDTRRKLIHMQETLAGKFAIGFRYGRNIQDIERKASPPQITRVFPRGRNDLDIASINLGVDYLENYDFYIAQGLTLEEAQERYRKDYVFQDDSYVEQPTLLRAGQKVLNDLSQPTVTYEAKVVDIGSITGYSEGRYKPGDFAVIEDEPLNIHVVARVARRVRYPYEPHRDEVELTNRPLLLPDGRFGAASERRRDWELFVSKNADQTRYIAYSTLLHRLPLIATVEAEWIIGFTIRGDVLSTGTIVISFDDDAHPGELYMPPLTIDVVAGEMIDVTVTTASKRVPVGNYTFCVRGNTEGGGNVRIDPGESVLWVLARGVVQGSVGGYDNEITFNFNGVIEGGTGTVQTWRVPDDVLEIQIEAVGAKGGGLGGGAGGTVTGVFAVIPGEWLDVYAAGIGGPGGSGDAQGNRGWPNGGEGGSTPSTHREGGGGGGSSHVLRPGLTFADALIVAAGGGANGYPFAPTSTGGIGGFLAGESGFSGGDEPGVRESFGATQEAGGSGGNGGAHPGTFGQGGNGGSDGNTLSRAGGGGGGGWYGGEGGSANVPWFTDNAVGGGGGSGHIHNDGWDLEYEDGVSSGHGYVTIRWATPILPEEPEVIIEEP